MVVAAAAEEEEASRGAITAAEEAAAIGDEAEGAVVVVVAVAVAVAADEANDKGQAPRIKKNLQKFEQVFFLLFSVQLSKHGVERIAASPASGLTHHPTTTCGHQIQVPRPPGRTR